MKRGSAQEGQLGGQRGPKADCGADARRGPTAQDGGVPVTPPHPAPQCPPFDPRALFREEEPGKPARSRVLLGTMHHVNTAWPLAFVRAEASPGEARTPNSEQSQAPGLQPEATWQGGGRAGSSTSWGPPGRGRAAAPALSPPRLLRAVSCVCELSTPPPLPCLEARQEGALPAAAQPHLWPQRAACSGRSGLVGPGLWSQGRWTFALLPSPPREPARVAPGRGRHRLWPQSLVWRLAARTELGLCGLRGAGAHIRALFAEVKGVFVSFWRLDRRRNNFPHSSLIPPFE